MVLKVDFSKRPTINEVIESSWLKPPPIDLSMTTQKLLSSVIQPQTQPSVEGNQILIKYLRVNIEDMLNFKMEEFNHKIMKLFEETQNLFKIEENNDTFQQYQLKFAIMLKLWYLLDKPFKHLNFVRNNNESDIMLEDVLNQKTLDIFIKSKSVIQGELNKIYSFLRDEMITSGIQIEGNNPNTLLLEYIIQYVEKRLYQDMLDSLDHINNLYLSVCLALNILVFDVDWIRVDIKVDYERLRKLGIEVDRDIVETSIQQDKINLFADLTKLEEKKILDLKMKLS